MSSSDSEVRKISEELKHISLKEQQLEERKKVLLVFQELRNRIEFGESEGAATQEEINTITERLQELYKRKAELLKSHENILKAKDKKDLTSIQEQHIYDSGSNIFNVEPPPSTPAPTVILDVEKLPPKPTRTQCPECRQFIVTEISSSISSVTWLVCVMSAMIGCVAGCCLLPFCMKRFKSITHRCPKCRTPIITLKKL